MADSFEVAQSSSEGELSDETRHEVVAAQLRGEAKAAGQGPEAVVARGRGAGGDRARARRV